MSSTILIRRSSTAGSVPTTAQLTAGELAINLADKKIYTNTGSSIIELGTIASTMDVEGALGVDGDFDVNTNKFTVASATGNTSIAGTLDVTGNSQVDGDFTVLGAISIEEPTANSHAATKFYVDQAVTDLIGTAGSALDTLGELADALNDDANFSATVTTALATKLNLAGGTMTGNIVMGANKVTSTATPTTADDLTRKGYIDALYGSTASAAASALAAETAETNAETARDAAQTAQAAAETAETNAASSASSASTSATNASNSASAASTSATSASNSASSASTSASNAATSATNAENAYDNFDDRYLGAKASDPTVDNDGDALITGAMYFDSTTNTTKVYNGSEWQAASSSIEGIKSDFQFSATNGQTVFSGGGLVIDKAGLTNVYLNGVRLPTADYTVDVAGNFITLGSGTVAGDVVEIEVFGNFAGQSGADVAITGGEITGLTELSTGTFTSTGIDDNATSTAMTIDASENVMIGRTSSGATNVLGHDFGSSGYAIHARDSANVMFLNRKTNDGSILEFLKDGLAVGSIGTIASDLTIGVTDTGLQFRDYRTAVTPFNITSNTSSDGVVSLGWSDNRFKDLYLSGEAKASKVTLDDSNGGDLIIKKNGTSSAFIGEQSAGLGSGDGLLIYTYNSGTIRFYPEAGSVATMDSDGLKMETGKGVYLGGTGSANKLDSYEEGSWTPLMTFDGSSTGITYSRNQGTYTKIGNRVFFELQMAMTSNGTATGVMGISLPFVISDEFALTGHEAACSLGLAQNIGSSSNYRVTIFNGQLEILDGGNSRGITDSSVGDGANFRISGQYRTT